MAAYGEKGLSLFLGPEKNSGFLFKYISIHALLLPTIYANLRKIVLGEKKLRGFEFFFAWGLMGKKWLNLFLRLEKTQGFLKNISTYLHCCCPQYTRI